MTSPTLIYEQAQGDPVELYAECETTRDITEALHGWAKRWCALGWTVQVADGGYRATVRVGGGMFFERQVWADIDPALCAEQLRIVLPAWLTTVVEPQPLLDRPLAIGGLIREIRRRAENRRAGR